MGPWLRAQSNLFHRASCPDRGLYDLPKISAAAHRFANLGVNGYKSSGVLRQAPEDLFG
jgi:hypothetical protein